MKPSPSTTAKGRISQNIKLTIESLIFVSSTAVNFHRFANMAIMPSLCRGWSCEPDGPDHPEIEAKIGRPVLATALSSIMSCTCNKWYLSVLFEDERAYALLHKLQTFPSAVFAKWSQTLEEPEGILQETVIDFL